jgi:hypothetical protein
MFNEYMNDESGALAALDEAVAALGEDVVIARALAKIFWRNDKHQNSVKILPSRNCLRSSRSARRTAAVAHRN